MDKIDVIHSKIISIEEVVDYKPINPGKLEGSNGSQRGMGSLISLLGGYRTMNGYVVKTNKQQFTILIDNEQSCCENWGYFSTDDDLNDHVGATLKDIELTDTALNVASIKEHDLDYLDAGGVQFVTFKTTRGDFQLAVYNAHNGYYGHGILVAIDDMIILDDTL